MSKKLLNKIVSAILILAICSTAFVGCIVSAVTPTATYTIHDGETVTPRDSEGTIEVTFTSDTPFAAVNFLVNDVVSDKWAEIEENGWLTISKAEIVADKTEMADPEAEVFIPQILVSSEFDEDAQDHINAVIVEGDASADKNYYTTLTLKLTLACTYTTIYVCQNDGCGWSYDMDEGDADYGIESGTWYTDLPEGKCPSCQGAASNFRKRNFDYKDGYKKFTISISEVVMTSASDSESIDEDAYSWTAEADTDGNGDDYIHSCTLREGDELRVSPDDENHFQVNDTYCLYCGNKQYQVVLDDTYEYDIDYTTTQYARTLYADAINMSYNTDGTVNLNVFVDQSYFVNGKNEKCGDWEVEAILVTNEQGEKFTRFSGENGQAKEDISTIKNSLDITSEQAAEYGYITDAGLKAFSFKNIPASDIGQNLLITVLGYRNSERDAGTGESLQYGTTLAYSVADYCYGVINGDAINATDDDKTVVAALLNYGATAQQYFSDETIAEENLPNYNLSAEYKNAYESVDFGDLSAEGASKPSNEDAYFYGTSIILRTNPMYKFYFRFFGDYVLSENVAVDFQIGSGETTSVKASEMQNSANSQTFHAYTLELGINQLRTPISFSIKIDGETDPVQTGSFSVAGYARAAEESGNTELANVSKAMLYYGDIVTARYGL